MREAAERPQFDAERSQTAPDLCGPQLDDPGSMQNAAERPQVQVNAERSCSRENSEKMMKNGEQVANKWRKVVKKAVKKVV